MSVELFVTTDQEPFVTSTARMISLFAGRRWGKTDSWFNRAIRLLLSKPIKYIYIAPGYSQAKDQYERMCSLIAPFIRRMTGQPKPKIWLKNGSSIEFRSFDRPKLIRGGGFHEAAVDESQDIKETDFNTVVRPLVSDNFGTIVLLGQFRGFDWRYKNYFVPGQKRLPDSWTKPTVWVPNLAYDDVFASWRFPSSSGLAFQGGNGKQELKLLEQQLGPIAYQQECDCIPAANQSAVFQHDQLLNIQRGGTEGAARSGYSYIMGLDLGRIVDNTAIVVLEVQTGVVVHATKLPLRMEHAFQAKLAGQIADRYRATVVMDSTGGATGGRATADSYVQFYRKTIRDLREFVFTAGNKERVIAQLCLEIQQGLVSIPQSLDTHDQSGSSLPEELRFYEYTYSNGRYDYHGAQGHHDDYVSAFAMAVWGRKAGWYSGGNGSALNSMMY